MSEQERVRIEVHGGQTRCPFCHDAVDVAGHEWIACADCLARHHPGCWNELGRCGTCGQVGSLAPPTATLPSAAGGVTRPPRSRYPRALAAMDRVYAPLSARWSRHVGAPLSRLLKRHPTLGVLYVPLVLAALLVALPLFLPYLLVLLIHFALVVPLRERLLPGIERALDRWEGEPEAPGHDELEGDRTAPRPPG